MLQNIKCINYLTLFQQAVTPCYDSLNCFFFFHFAKSFFPTMEEILNIYSWE